MDSDPDYSKNTIDNDSKITKQQKVEEFEYTKKTISDDSKYQTTYKHLNTFKFNNEVFYIIYED